MARVNCGFTLEETNLSWLRKRAAEDNRSLSNMLDRLLEQLQASARDKADE